MRDFVIKPLNQACMDACQLRVDNLTKPIYSLAQLEKSPFVWPASTMWNSRTILKTAC